MAENKKVDRCVWGPKVGTRVCSLRMGRRICGTVMDPLDPKAWREERRHAKHNIVPYPWTEDYGSDLSHGRTVPQNRDSVRHAARKLILHGGLNLCEVTPVRWDFGRVYWERISKLRPGKNCANSPSPRSAERGVLDAAYSIPLADRR